MRCCASSSAAPASAPAGSSSRCRPRRARSRATAGSRPSASRRRARRWPAPSWASPSGPATGDGAPTRGFILTGPRRGPFEVARSDDFDVTDLAFLPTGELLLLERHFSLLRGVSAPDPPRRGGRDPPGRPRRRPGDLRERARAPDRQHGRALRPPRGRRDRRDDDLRRQLFSAAADLAARIRPRRIASEAVRSPPAAARAG